MRLPRSLGHSAIALLAWSSLVLEAAAQVHTDCFPMNKTCPPDPGFGMDYNFVFNATPNVNVWEETNQAVTYNSQTGASFKITKQLDSPTLRTKFYYFWGRTEIHMKAAKGRGIISSIMMLSDNLDEIDWEFFGTNDTYAQSNFFAKGIDDHTGAVYHPVSFNVHDDYHNYTTDWTKDRLDFYIDGKKVRTLLPSEANNTYNYPQTPMRLSIGIWAGGDSSMPEGTREWAGGDTDYSQGPFEMFVRSAHVTDYSNGKQYIYTDRSGSWQSIKVVEGNSTVHEIINAPPEKSLSDKWNDLPQTAKIAIYASAAGFGGLLVIAAVFYCIRQRRRGAREARAAEARAEAERLELERFKKAGVDPDSFVSNASEYNAKEMHRDGISDKDSYSVPSSPAPDASSPFEKHWGSAAGAAAGAAAVGGAAAMRSPVPLLRDGAQSPRVASPGIYSDRPGNARSPGPGGFEPREGGSRSPAPSRHAQSPAPGMASPTQQYAHPGPPSRSFTSPAPQARMGSPAPSQHRGFGGMERAASPAQLAHPQPQRSFTTDGYGGQAAAYGGSGGGNQGYWGNHGGGYR